MGFRKLSKEILRKSSLRFSIGFPCQSSVVLHSSKVFHRFPKESLQKGVPRFSVGFLRFSSAFHVFQALFFHLFVKDILQKGLESHDQFSICFPLVSYGFRQLLISGFPAVVLCSS